MRRVKIGQKVRVKGQRRVAIIERFFRDIPGGVKLDRMIGGFHCWNVDDLALWKTPRRNHERV